MYLLCREQNTASCIALKRKIKTWHYPQAGQKDGQSHPHVVQSTLMVPKYSLCRCKSCKGSVLSEHPFYVAASEESSPSLCKEIRKLAARLTCHIAHVFDGPQSLYTGCPRRNMRDFGRVFLMLNYTDITQNTYIQSWTVTEIMAREVWNFDSCYSLIDYQIHIETDRNMWFL